ncbi:MAG TPA: hypothetical protein VL977_08255, partial [Solirubrobacteraceae bacterium]|nr:hypothetical protein [Solirubrobacteraceae bacterium]
HALAATLTKGAVASALAHVPPALRAQVALTAKAGYISGLNEVLLIGAVVAFTGAVLSFVLIRQRDFVLAHAPSGAGEPAIVAG